MTTSLIDSLNGLATPELTSRLASSLNEPGHSIAGGLTGGFSSMLLGVLSKCGDPTAMQSLFSLVTDSANDGHILDDPASLVGSGQTSPMSSLGGQFLSSVFGERSSAVTDAISRSTGLHISAVSSLLQFGAPLLLAVLGKQVREGGLNLSSFSEMIGKERNAIERTAPRGVATALGMKEFTPSTPDYEIPLAAAPEADVRPRVRRPEPEKSNRWIMPTVAVLAAIALMWGVSSRDHRNANYTPAPTTISGGEVSIPTTTSGTLKLRNGVVLSVPSASSEGKLVAYMTGSPHGITSWVVLDHMQFENNSTKLAASSDQQIENLGKILAAYPEATVKIGGFTDNVGNPAENMKLSRERAEAARDAIVRSGVDAKRVSAQGFGEQGPIASNSTEEGRAQNRRIAVLVTSH
jgi:outer membrane protein OmpA-like peptidoglycan-associated protein